jgi:hypothetical protein
MVYNNFKICPRCMGYIPNNYSPGEYPGAISRLDNKTEICSECGVQEAIEDFERSMKMMGDQNENLN